ncbi:MAG: short-chain dehydrogenase [Candidatus Kapaibacterium sp.]
MQIKGSKVLILGGWGLVGSAICHKLMEHSPAQLIVSSLNKHEAEDAVENLRKEYPDHDPEMFVPKWGNIFTRNEWKDDNWGEVLASADTRKGFINDIFMELDEKVLNKSFLYSMILESKPDLVIDCINTATAIAYLDIYNTAVNTIKKIESGGLDESWTEKLLASSYIPQLIRHVQILYNGLLDAGTTMYFKVGTSGTGGMGMNIPYTHSEERPSRVLMSKTAVAGAQSLLLFLMARTPDGPLVKEIKPSAAIAWKRITYDKVMRKGRPIELVDMDPAGPKKAEGKFVFDDASGVKDTGDVYRSVFIDTGENGIFSKGEFQAISALGQMEIVTPEEIAEYLVHEVRGGNTGRDIIQGLDSTVLGPTYRGGMLRNIALQKINSLEKEFNTDSVAFELLGPPRLSKLLYEGYLMRKIAGSMTKAVETGGKEFSDKALELIKNNADLRAQMLSIGLVILMPDGENYLRGKEVKIPVRRGVDELEITPENIDQWCYEGWIDLRPGNFEQWKERLKTIMDQAKQIPGNETSSRYTYTKDYWDNFENIDEGKIAGWIFEYEDKGWRFKR